MMSDQDCYPQIQASIKSSFLSIIGVMGLMKIYRNYPYLNLNDFLSNIALSYNGKHSRYYLSKNIQKYALDQGQVERRIIIMGLRYVFSAAHEGFEKSPTFRAHFHEKLKQDNYEALKKMTRLLRNVYSHEVTSGDQGNIFLTREHFKGFVNYQRQHECPDEISLNISQNEYRQFLLATDQAPSHFNLKISFQLSDLENGKNLDTIISHNNRILLAEFFYYAILSI